MKVVAEDVAPSLRFDSAKVSKAGRAGEAPKQAQAPRDESPFDSEPPF